MRFGKVRVCAVGAAAAAFLAASGGAAVAQTTTTYKQATFKAQDAKVKQMLAAVNMTKDEQSPARAFTAPTSIAVDPSDPRIMAAATANQRNKTCYLTVSTDAGATWHLSKEAPGAGPYPYCTNTSAATPEVSLAWGRNGTLYYARQAYGDGEGPREGRSSIMLARTTDLGVTWKTTMVEDNRSQPDPSNTANVAASATGVTGLAVDTSGARDVVYVGYSRSYTNAPAGSALRNAHLLLATSTDAGVTFGKAVDLNEQAQRPSVTLGDKSYPLLMRTGFGAPFITVHNGTLLVVAGPDFSSVDPAPIAPPESGAGGSPGSWFNFALPQLIARSTDEGKTFNITTLDGPKFDGTGAMTGLGWTAKGGSSGTFLAAYAATPATSPTSGVADIVMQRSTDGGVTWSEPLALDDIQPGDNVNNFYPEMSVAPNGRVDVVWQDNRGLADNLINVRYTYSTDGGLTWAPSVVVNDRVLNFNYGISFNSDLRYPPGVASTNQYAVIGWADSRFADEVTQTQDAFSSVAQFAPLPTTKNTVAPKLAAAFGGVLVAGVVLLIVLQFRRRDETSPAPVRGQQPVPTK
jgi:hypothetical protein